MRKEPQLMANLRALQPSKCKPRNPDTLQSSCRIHVGHSRLSTTKMRRTIYHMSRVPKRYVPEHLFNSDKRRAKAELRKSRKAYKRGRYYTRRNLKSFKTRPSKWVSTIRAQYSIPRAKKLTIPLLSRKSKCSKKTLRKIIRKGRGAYYSSGSRPNQTPTSWGRARLYSSLSGGPAARIDLHLLKRGCRKNSKALELAGQSISRGLPRRTRKYLIKLT